MTKALIFCINCEKSYGIGYYCQPVTKKLLAAAIEVDNKNPVYYTGSCLCLWEWTINGWL